MKALYIVEICFKRENHVLRLTVKYFMRKNGVKMQAFIYRYNEWNLMLVLFSLLILKMPLKESFMKNNKNNRNFDRLLLL